ncbi:glycosyltransferase family 2 protein [Empedobacter sp. UBA1574]|uniref:glycosyltransferase family 2 protein n=1 Tax=Empedobacter sp. UBA1574 TaxID=1946429 RepID=UPI0025BE1BA1|nr:glycosyltransferase family A protein [Empedobacter sp. UBA1574]
MNNSLISIIIPVYNSEKNILETLKSVHNLSYENYECILIDDGSIDKSKNIISNYIKDIPQFKLISIDNSGVCTARNIGVEKANGKFLLFLDSDDLLENNFLNETFNNYDNWTDVVATKVIFFGRSSGEYLPNYFNINDLLHENKLVITCLIEKDKFLDVGGFNTNMKDGFEDWDFWIRYINKFPNVRIIETTKFYYRLQQKSRNRDIDEKKETLLRFQIWQNNFKLFSKEFINPKLTFEYKNIRNSLEFKVGRFLMRPIRFLLKK